MVDKNAHYLMNKDGVFRRELFSNLVFETYRSCGDLVLVCGFNSVFEADASDDFGEAIKSA